MTVVALTSGSGNWEVPAGVSEITVLVVAGGGSGALVNNGSSGGGGAGGVLFLETLPVTPAQQIAYSVGLGGASRSGANNEGEKGQNTIFGSYIAEGGGYGSRPTGGSVIPGGDGGSGGGAGAGNLSEGTNSGGSGITGQGNDGGTGSPNSTVANARAGGGGGAGTAGVDGTTGRGDGGDGLYFGNVFGDGYGDDGWFGGGGGGSTGRAGPESGAGIGGKGGGGRGGFGTGEDGLDGLANTGGGGGGASTRSDGSKSGAGGSGVILILYSDSQNSLINQTIALPLSLTQQLIQFIPQKETINQNIKPELKLQQQLTKGFTVSGSVKLDLKLVQELYRSIEGYGPATVLFNEPLPIEQISLTFDQLGRPLVFYRVGDDTLKLYWYDPVLQENVTAVIATGIDPQAGFDFPTSTGEQFTDALLFYVRDDQVFMRIQRDRFATEYPCPATQPGLRLISNGLRVDNRYQVVYQYKDDGYVPPVVPDPVIPIEGDYRYFMNTLAQTPIAIASNTQWMKMGFRLHHPVSMRTSVSSSQQNGNYQLLPFGTLDSDLFIALRIPWRIGFPSTHVYLSTVVGGVTWSDRGGNSNRFALPANGFLGEWEIHIAPRQALLFKDGELIGNLDTGTSKVGPKDPTKLLSLGGVRDGRGRIRSSDATFTDFWFETDQIARVDWPMVDAFSAVQPSIPAGSDAEIQLHESRLWQFAKE